MENQRLNIELFKKIRDRIAMIPASYDQSNWCIRNDAAPCGTAACIAGEAVICSQPSIEAGITELRRLMHLDKYNAVPKRAAELLGIARHVARAGR